MRTIDEYMKLPYRMEIVEDISEGGYVVSYPDLNGCITCADTIEAAIANAKDAKLAWLEAAVETGCEIPEPDGFGFEDILVSLNCAFQNHCTVS